MARFDAILDMVVLCGITLVEMQCGTCDLVSNVLWDGQCDVQFIFECDVHDVMRGGMWA